MTKFGFLSGGESVKGSTLQMGYYIRDPRKRSRVLEVTHGDATEWLCRAVEDAGIWYFVKPWMVVERLRGIWMGFGDGSFGENGFGGELP